MDGEVTSAYQYKSLFEKALAALEETTNSSGQNEYTNIVNTRDNKTANLVSGAKCQRYLSTSSSGSDTQIERPWTSPATRNNHDFSHQRAGSPVRQQHSDRPRSRRARKISTETLKHDVRPLTPESTCQRNIKNWLAFNENVQKRSASADRYNSSIRNKRTVYRPVSPEGVRISKRGRSRQKKKSTPDYLVLNNGEVFSPILWRKFHIDEHLFDTTKGFGLTEEEINENMNQMKIKYPHLTKYYNQNDNYDISNTMEDKRQRLFNKLPDQTEDEHATQNYLWKRHVDMMKVSKSTSYYNFLSHFDRQSCRACSHSKTCSSKHCGSCDCGTKCEKHAINIDFLKYRPYTSISSEPSDQKKQILMSKQNQNLKSDSRSSPSNHGLTMQGFTIMRKTPDMGRKTLLSTHIDGQHCTSKSGHKKCLACAMAKENVLMQSRKKPFLHPKSAPARLRRLNIVRSSSVPPPAI